VNIIFIYKKKEKKVFIEKQIIVSDEEDDDLLEFDPFNYKKPTKKEKIKIPIISRGKEKEEKNFLFLMQIIL